MHSCKVIVVRYLEFSDFTEYFTFEQRSRSNWHWVTSMEGWHWVTSMEGWCLGLPMWPDAALEEHLRRVGTSHRCMKPRTPNEVTIYLEERRVTMSSHDSILPILVSITFEQTIKKYYGYRLVDKTFEIVSAKVWELNGSNSRTWLGLIANKGSLMPSKERQTVLPKSIEGLYEVHKWALWSPFMDFIKHWVFK